MVNSHKKDYPSQATRRQKQQSTIITYIAMSETYKGRTLNNVGSSTGYNGERYGGG
jgi:hypothetical protein